MNYTDSAILVASLERIKKLNAASSECSASEHIELALRIARDELDRKEKRRLRLWPWAKSTTEGRGRHA